MSQVRPIIELTSQIVGALVGGKMVLDAVTGNTPSQAASDAAEAARREREAAGLENTQDELKKGLKGYLRSLADVAPTYVARHRPRLEEGYEEWHDRRNDPDVL